jgi:hypothetical protein
MDCRVKPGYDGIEKAGSDPGLFLFVIPGRAEGANPESRHVL